MDEERANEILAKMYGKQDAVKEAAIKYEDAARGNWAPEMLAFYFGPLKTPLPPRPRTVTTIDTDKLHQITTLAHGAHQPNDGAMCAMEAAAHIAGEPWSDHPQCVSPVIAAFLRSWNDALPDADRTRLLLPLIPDTIGTRTTDADEETRAWRATDWLVRVQTPAWLRLAGLTDHAQALESCARIVDAATARAEQPKIDAAWAAAGDAARGAAWAAARGAARAAAWDAAGAAARDAAGDAAWAAARDAARDTARDAARGAAGDAARAAARAAAWDALAPTVATLQASACDLVRAMCAVGREAASRDEHE